MRWGRTILIWITGIILIPAGLFYVMFGNFDLANLNSVHYTYDSNKLEQVITKNGLYFDDGVLHASNDDAYFFIELPRRCRIKEVRVFLTDVDLTQTAQIYYSSSKEMHGEQYWECPLKNGENTFWSNTLNYVKWLRLDLTAKAGDSFCLQNIQIVLYDDIRIQYFIFCPLLLLLYISISFIGLNKSLLLKWVSSNQKYKQKLEITDQIISLSCSDFQNRFSGSYLGVFWGVLQPLSNILLFWFVFQVGFRSNPVGDVPFILWLSAGMIPWNYFYDSWYGGTSAFTSYAYIVKKVVFKIEILPLVKVLSATILNLIFNGILIIIYCLYGRFMGFHIFDMMYFSFCLFCLTLALSYITATLNVFIKDVGLFMGIVLQILMWMTPLMWSYEMIPDMPYCLMYKLNPLFYVLNGYRESLIYGSWFYTHWLLMIWFWCVTLLLLFTGKKLMSKMKDQFADVL